MILSENDKEFIELLEQVPVRLENKRTCDRHLELTDEEFQSILSLQNTESLEKACEILKPVYQKYKGSSGKRQMPELVIRGIYFIIFRELCLMISNDEKLTAQKRIMLFEDGKLRKRILPKCTNKVYQLLGEKSSKPQERLGIQPLKDFTALYYEPVRFHVPSLKDRLFRELFLNIMLCADNAMFIDLTGEDSVLGDIYYCDREVVLCRDSVTANFYYALQLRYKEFCRHLQSKVQEMEGDIKEIISLYESQLEKRNIQTVAQLKDNEDVKKICSGDKAVVLTYPLQFEDVDIDLAVQYFLVQLNLRYQRTVGQLQKDITTILQNQLQWLQQRFEKTIISWCSVEEMLKNIKNGEVSFLHLEKRSRTNVVLAYKPDNSVPNVRHYTYYENLEDTFKREEKEREIDCEIDGCCDEEIKQIIKKYTRNKEKRIKKGFLFFDFNVRRDMIEAEIFAQFTEKNECQWAFVCDRTDRYWTDRLKGDKVKILEVDEKNPYAHCLQVCGYRDIMIITNVNVQRVMVGRIKSLLVAFDVSNIELMNSLIRIRSNTGRENEFEE